MLRLIDGTKYTTQRQTVAFKEIAKVTLQINWRSRLFKNRVGIVIVPYLKNKKVPNSCYIKIYIAHDLKIEGSNDGEKSSQPFEKKVCMKCVCMCILFLGSNS